MWIGYFCGKDDWHTRYLPITALAGFLFLEIFLGFLSWDFPLGRRVLLCATGPLVISIILWGLEGIMMDACRNGDEATFARRRLSLFTGMVVSTTALIIGIWAAVDSW